MPTVFFYCLVCVIAIVLVVIITAVIVACMADWAVQNTHREIVKLLVNGVQDLDVLSRNNFGRGCVTEAFQCDDPEICTSFTARRL